ncbi:hypothetical protein [Desulfovibrio sp. SGI.169]|uniref:hypothetical protein n=1 Tax=Desulfovibrio sp. SGI.169 TaxID=3420561 RepID=UPI003D0753F0
MKTCCFRPDWLQLVVVAVFMIGLPLAFLLSSRELSGGAEIMPMAMGGVMILTALASLRGRLRCPAAAAAFPALKALGVGAALLLFPAAASLLGFYTASWLLVVGGFLLFTGRVSLKATLQGALTASIFCTAAWALFYHVFVIQTPKGLFY